MWLSFVLCMKVLLFNPFFLDSHLEYMVKMETSLSKASFDLYNHRIFKTRRETLKIIKPISSYHWWGNCSTNNQSNFAQSHISDEWQCKEQNPCFSLCLLGALLPLCCMHYSPNCGPVNLHQCCYHGTIVPKLSSGTHTFRKCKDSINWDFFHLIPK